MLELWILLTDSDSQATEIGEEVKNALRELPAPQVAWRLENYEGGSYEKRYEAAYNANSANEVAKAFLN